MSHLESELRLVAAEAAFKAACDQLRDLGCNVVACVATDRGPGLAPHEPLFPPLCVPRVWR